MLLLLFQHIKIASNCISSFFSNIIFVLTFLALNETMMKLSKTGQTLEDYNYQNEGIADIILNEIADVQFKGMSVSPFIINFGNVRYRMSLIMGF